MSSQGESRNPEGEEARLDPRRRLLKGCQILSLDKRATSAIDCTLRNISSSGAQLGGPETSLSRIPDEFYLVAPGQLRTIRCKVVWRFYGAVGIKFLSDPGNLVSGDANDPKAASNATPKLAMDYVLDPTTGAVVEREALAFGKAPSPTASAAESGRYRELERSVSAALGLRVEIAGSGEPGWRVAVHVQTIEQLHDVCRKLAQD
jgi:hypothetical protein